jgi:lipopolysaccharide transport system permease protein
LTAAALDETAAGGSAGRTQYVELLRALLRRDLRARYKGSLLGVVWSYLTPLIMMGVYTLVFSVLWQVISLPNYPLFVLVGLAVWRFFSAALPLGTSSFVANAHIITKVHFPRQVVPLAAVLSEGLASLVMFAVVIPVALVVEPEAIRTLPLAIPLFASLVLLTIGLAWMLATLQVFFRDVEHLLASAMLPWFLLTPVFYSLEQLPGGVTPNERLVDALRYGNPITPYVESIRDVMMYATVPAGHILAYALLAGPIAFVTGLVVVRHFEDRLAVEL